MAECKPEFSMKVVTKWLEICATAADCTECPYRKMNHCRICLMADAAWYLRMTLEKSAKAPKRKELTDAAAS